MNKIVGYKREGQEFTPIYEEIPDKTNKMNLNLSMIDTNTWEGRMLIATLSQLSTGNDYKSKQPDDILNEMKGIMDFIYKDNPLPESKVEETLTFGEEIRNVINRYSRENDSDTPDYILAQYVIDCLNSYATTVRLRDQWFRVDMWTEDKRIKKEQDGV